MKSFFRSGDSQCLSMLNNLSMPVLVADRDFTITFANKASLDVLNTLSPYLPVPVDKIVGSNLDVLNKRSFADGKTSHIEFKLGNQWLSMSATMLRDKRGEFNGAFINWAVITQAKYDSLNFNGQLAAISKTQAVIEFNMDGTIINANENFLAALDYTLDEIKGKHHAIFLDPSYRSSPEYAQFWESLNRGQYQQTEYKRFGKNNKEVWILASYNPILDDEGKPFKVVKYATDISKQKLQVADFSGQIKAIGKAQAVIEFNMDGTIINANLNFLHTLGYTLDEIKGRHHSIFVDPSYRSSPEYTQFWDTLARGQYQQAEYKRFGKGGKEVWIQASYNPILDLNGKPFKVVKYATDITKQKLQSADFSGQIDAIGKSQAVIEFNMDGTIANANPNFLGAVGYNLDEIKGKHHSMFVEPAYKNSTEYKQFWDTLNRGEFQQAEYKRMGKGGKEIWIQASYNPIMDMNGKPFKVVKYATDVTQMVTNRTENEMGMNEAVSVLTGLSEGNLTRQMDKEYKGTFSQIKGALNATIERLKDTVLRIKESAESVNSASSEISAGSTNLSQRTEEQASSLEETAASMEQLTGTVRQNSENARNANSLSSEAQNVAERGGQVVGEAVNAMNSIEKSSKKISDIISVIDEIAFHTNLLALNAAVEAARAGDAGKGFAVVASEVRSLAGRSATASKEIKALIMESSSQVKTGAELVNQAGSTLKDIVGSVKKVAQIISEIANASAEQSTGIDEINTAVSQMDEMTQQNAALVEQNTAAAQSLVQQAQSLGNMVSFFKVDERDTAPSAHHAFEPVIVKPSAKPRPVAKPRTPPPRPSKSPMLTDRKLIASSNTPGNDREWEEF